MKIKFILFFLGAIYLSSKAQDCTTKLQTAQQLFESGQIEQIPVLLDSCLKFGFSPEERIKAYQLLVQVYLFDYNQVKTDSLMVRFLQFYPTYKTKAADPIEFANQFKTYSILPLWGIGISVGTGVPLILVKEQYSTFNLQQLESSYKPNSLNFSAGLSLNRYVSHNLWFALGLNYRKLSVKKNDDFASGKEKINYTEKINWLTSNFTINYGLGNSSFCPYGFLGGEFGYLQSSKSEIRRMIYSETQYPEIVRPFTDISQGRNKFNVWAIGGVGVNYLIPKGSVKASLGYSYSLLSYVKPEYRYSDKAVILYYQFLEDDIMLNHLFLNISYSRVFYKIKKKTVDEN